MSSVNRSNSWKRLSYPLQSPPEEVPYVEQPPSPVSENPSAPVQLPRYIRAVRDNQSDRPRGRTIVVCLDGTGDKFDADNSNIVHIVSCLKKDDPAQVTYYQSGIGTYDGGGMKNGMSAALDMAVGSGLGIHIKDAYQFLMEAYKEGDRICLFGFSRGAYTVRCLGGMLHKVGLLPAKNVAQISFAYQFYKDDSEEGWKMSADFKKTFCIDVHVHFSGVFDSVASVGFIPRKLPFSSSPTSRTGHFRHAMALDEHRSKFKVCHWQNKDQLGIVEQGKRAHQSPAKAHTNGAVRRPSSRLNGASSVTSPPSYKSHFDSEHEMRAREDPQGKKTDVVETWFMGCHADVGGGAVKNEERHKLSQIPLRWMLRQAFECDTGIIFDTARLAEIGLDVHTLWPTYVSLGVPLIGPSPTMMEKYEKGLIAPLARRSTALEPIDEDEKDGTYEIKLLEDEERMKGSTDWLPEQVEDYFDAMSTINDQLVQSKGWWVLEYWPIKYRRQMKNSDAWEKVTGCNRGRFRAVQEPQPNLHWTVSRRMHDKAYTLRARFGRNALWREVV